ncbi:MAG: prolipoprotein diacylglyceryl transferase [Deltaproteobacteria bacterium]|nr:prolipoprotein diacylglyceryl transferase [Candidatus Anaeroferrophillus wilburensis]
MIKWGGLTIHTYGLLVAIGFLMAMIYAVQAGKKEGLAPDLIYDLFFYALLFAIIGARILYVLINSSYYRSHPLEILYIWQGGLVFYGGFLAAVAAVYIKLRIHHLAVMQVADIAAPALALAQAIGRLGCLAAGCCYGGHCGLPFALIFSDPASLAPLHVALHPTQIYHAVANGLLFVILAWHRHHRSFVGQSAVLYLLLYPVGRFTIEFFRGDQRGGWWLFSTSQWISVVLFLCGLALLVALKGFGKPEPPAHGA